MIIVRTPLRLSFVWGALGERRRSEDRKEDREGRRTEDGRQTTEDRGQGKKKLFVIR